MTTQAASLAAVHAQSRAKPIESVPVPPAAGDVSTEFVRRIAHRGPEGPVVDCSAAVQAAEAAATVSESSRAAATRRRQPDLIRFERPGARLMRNLSA